MGTLQSMWLLSPSRHRRYFTLWLHRLRYHAGFSLRNMSSTRWFPCPISALKHSVTGENVSHTPPERDIYPAGEPPMRCPLNCFLPTSEAFNISSSFLFSLSPFPSSLSSAFPPLHLLSLPMRTCSSPSWEAAAATATHKGLG